MNDDELRSILVSSIRQLLAAYKALKTEVASGRLVAQANGWYKIVQLPALVKVGFAADELRAKDGKVTHIRIPKQRKSLASMARKLGIEAD